MIFTDTLRKEVAALVQENFETSLFYHYLSNLK